MLHPGASVDHSEPSTHEYRFVPVGGHKIIDAIRTKGHFTVRLLDGTPLQRSTEYGYSRFNYSVWFTGEEKDLGISDITNTEWICNPSKSTLENSGPIASFERLQNSIPIPTQKVLTEIADRYTDNTYVKKVNSGQYWYFWNGVKLRDTLTSRTNIDAVVNGVKYNFKVGDNEYKKKYRIIQRVISEENKDPTYRGEAIVTGGSGSDATVYLKLWGNGAAKWSIRRDGKDFKQGDNVNIKHAGKTVATVMVATVNSKQGEFASDPDKNESYFPFNAACDYFWNTTESSSHLNGPEHQLAFVNEIVRQSVGSQYEKLSLQGLKLLNSKEWSSFSDVSGWFKQGLAVTKPTGLVGPTNLLPEIAYALLTDERLGAGSLIGKSAVDAAAMANAARWCEANGFYWDGVISNSINLREFIFEQAGFCLLDFCIKGGQFALQPSFPQGSDGGLNKEAKVEISGLFTDGNMKDLEVTFLSPEEQQGFVAVAIYRQESVNGFPENRTVNVRLNGTTDVLPVEKFDLTQFCTSRDHALLFCKIALKIRELQDHGIKFQTTPQAAMGLEPGQYVKMVSQATHTDRWRNGSVDQYGNINSAQDMANFSGNVAYWKRNTEEIKEGLMNVNHDGVVVSPEFWNSVFSVLENNEESRVYKIESLSYDDDGLVEVAASHSPLTERGTLAVLDFEQEDFEVDG